MPNDTINVHCKPKRGRGRLRKKQRAGKGRAGPHRKGTRCVVERAAAAAIGVTSRPPTPIATPPIYQSGH